MTPTKNPILSKVTYWSPQWAWIWGGHHSTQCKDQWTQYSQAVCSTRHYQLSGLLIQPQTSCQRRSQLPCSSWTQMQARAVVCILFFVLIDSKMKVILLCKHQVLYLWDHYETCIITKMLLLENSFFLLKLNIYLTNLIMKISNASIKYHPAFQNQIIWALFFPPMNN